MGVKESIKASGVNQWEIAEKLNISEFTLSRWLRRPENLSKEVTNNILKAIDSVKANKSS